MNINHSSGIITPSSSKESINYSTTDSPPEHATEIATNNNVSLMEGLGYLSPAVVWPDSRVGNGMLLTLCS